MIQYKIKKLCDVLDDELCSVDPEYTVASLAGMIAAHQCGVLDIDDHMWFGHKDNYRFAPDEAPAIVKITDDSCGEGTTT